MDKDRRLAFLVLKDIEENGRWANLALGAALSGKPSGKAGSSKDPGKSSGKAGSSETAANPAFVRELVYGVLRNQKLLDYNIARFLKKPKLSVNERLLLRMGFYQLALMDGVADHAAINETVTIAAAFMKGRQGFINAVLRSFQRDGKRLLDDGPLTRWSCAKWIADLWTAQYGADKAEALMQASCTPAPLTIRANLARISRADLKAALQSGADIQGAAAGQSGAAASANTKQINAFEVKETALSDRCLEVKGSGLLDTQLYKQGYFSVQGEASCCAVDQLLADLTTRQFGDSVTQQLNIPAAQQPRPLIVDLCAAPGGKSCAAAELLATKQNSAPGSVLSFDLYPHRVELIEKEAKRLGLGSIITAKAADTQQPLTELFGKADYVIADVPCSGLGTLRRDPEIKLRERTPAESAKALEELTKIQYNILVNALRIVKPGGRVAYSTCTVNKAENGDLVRRALADIAGQAAGDAPTHGSQAMSAQASSASTQAAKRFAIVSEIQLFQTEGGPDGFYICVIAAEPL